MKYQLTYSPEQYFLVFLVYKRDRITISSSMQSLEVPLSTRSSTASSLVVTNPSARTSLFISGRLSSGNTYVMIPLLGPNSQAIDSVKETSHCERQYSIYLFHSLMSPPTQHWTKQLVIHPPPSGIEIEIVQFSKDLDFFYLLDAKLFL